MVKGILLMSDANDTRVCVKCQRELPETEEFFYRRKSKSKKADFYIFRAECRECNKLQQKRYRDENPDKVKERHQREWVTRTPEQIERDKKRSRENARKEEYKKQRIEYYEENRDAILDYHKQYYRNNTDRAKIKRDRRRARFLKAEGEYTVADIQLHYKNQKGKCWYCQIELNGKYHIDHRIPLSRGGSNYPNNLALTCSRCNLSKSDKLPHEWRGRLL